MIDAVSSRRSRGRNVASFTTKGVSKAHALDNCRVCLKASCINAVTSALVNDLIRSWFKSLSRIKGAKSRGSAEKIFGYRKSVPKQ